VRATPRLAIEGLGWAGRCLRQSPWARLAPGRWRSEASERRSRARVLWGSSPHLGFRPPQLPMASERLKHRHMLRPGLRLLEPLVVISK
jgi:hypothetical protein